MTLGELLARIGLAFTRIWQHVSDGNFGALVLSDLGIVAAVAVGVLFILTLILAIFVAVSE